MNEHAVAGRDKFNWRSKLINPVLDKEFRLRMRTPRAMWTLFFYLFALGLMSLSAIYLTQGMSGRGAAFNPEQSKILFYFLSMAQLGLIAFMAPGLTAGVISGEREKQTLNLLLTTQQSSATIVLSKLVSSLSFMILIVFATVPVYSMMFLYGGVSPKQLVLVFVFYLFMMIVLGSFGVLFSTLLKRTMISVISTYGVTLFMFAGTAILFFVMQSVMDQARAAGTISATTSYSWVGHIIALNPVGALYSILDPSISDQAFMVNRWSGNTQPKGAPMALWQEFMIVFGVLAIFANWMAIRNLRPRLRGRTGRK
ncbi:ABC transporter permease [Paenibacillus agaridevorans]|uniref:ABC transporter permease n=1 Tax=Paenibacillus agaridevorans TaxID=171404 RepID=A0A2R5EXB5_9BACL|nr:ABC transporter permease [Paenibacillus agaridevorans]GBG09698.1 ABC transporter permease [Paenibacillus agaridevorans]